MPYEPGAKFKRLFWDVETSPNVMFSWRAGYKINLDVQNIIHERAIICICWKWEGKKRVWSLKWDDGDDREMIERFSSIIQEADELVAHNGDKFDMKWYNGRHLLHGLDPVPISKTVDTLKIARKRFYLNSNRLDYLAKKLFGEGKIHTSFDLWRNCIEITQPDPDIRAHNVGKMVRYCKKDVVLLERVHERLRSYEEPSVHAAVAASGNPMHRWMCPHCGSSNVVTTKTRTTAKGMVQHQMKCWQCNRYYSIAHNVHNWYLAAKEGA